MKTLLKNNLVDLDELNIQAEQAEIVAWQGHKALRLENGLALIPDFQIADARIEVMIGVDGPAYPGLAFRLSDVLNFELAYPVPHVSGAWDALQYDPVFHGSNTWQLYCGPAYQRAAQVPTGSWFRLQVDVGGWQADGYRAAFSVDGQPPLVVERLARPTTAGLLGVWTYQPAYFRNLRVSTPKEEDLPHGEKPALDEDAVRNWFMEGYGVVNCEANGVINLNRYLRAPGNEARLTRRFEMSAAGEVSFDFGFSDTLMLELDGEVVFQGENLFKGFADRPSRGYVELGAHSQKHVLPAGQHRLTAIIGSKEPFGWGLVFSAYGDEMDRLPAELG